MYNLFGAQPLLKEFGKHVVFGYVCFLLVFSSLLLLVSSSCFSFVGFLACVFVFCVYGRSAVVLKFAFLLSRQIGRTVQLLFNLQLSST